MNDAGEKRQLPRWLCNRNFSATVLIDGHQYDMRPINFNHLGIGLFCGERLPQASHCMLTLSYHSDTIHIQSADIPAEIMYTHETEVGSDYGMRFDLANIAAQLQADLLTVEQELAQRQSGGDRYGVFG